MLVTIIVRTGNLLYYAQVIYQIPIRDSNQTNSVIM